jgi:DNA invertase Pin-like site-specific DNA recombinase
MRAAIYCRLSQDRQQLSAAVDRQEADCRELCAARGWDVADVFVDNDVSAYSGKRRPGFEALLEAVSRGQCGAAVTWKSDRLARRGRDLQRFLDACELHGVTLTSVTEPSFDGAAGLLMLRLVSSFAEHESSVKSERVARAAKQRAERGRPHGGNRRFGYTDDWQPHPVEAPLVQEAVCRVLAGESSHAIVADWNGRGVVTTLGHCWRPGNFSRMLRSPAYAGLRSHNGHVAAACWDALVTPVEHDLLQALLAGRVRPDRAVTRHLLTGLLKCGACGGRMNGFPDHGRPSYRCAPDDGCGNVSIRSAIVEPFVVQAVTQRAPLREQAQLLPQLRSNLTLLGRVQQLDDLLGALAELEAARFVERSIAHRSYLRLREPLLERIEAARAEVAVEHGVDALVFVGDLAAEWPERPLEWRRRVLMSMVERITVAPGRGTGRVSIHWR